MRPHSYVTLLLAMAIPLGCFSCKRQVAKVRTIDRALDAPGPTSQQVHAESLEDQYKNMVYLPDLGQPIAAKTPDGEIWARYPNGLMIHDLIPSVAIQAVYGQRVTITYVGTFPGQTKPFDQRGKDNPFTFQLGSNDVIMGMNLGVTRMCIGGKRRIFVPPDLGYGQGYPAGGIPPNQALIFEVQLLSVSGEGFPMPDPPKVDTITPSLDAGPPAPSTAPASAPAP